MTLPDLYTDDETVTAALHYITLALWQRTRPDVHEVLGGPPDLPGHFWPADVAWEPADTPKDNIRRARHLLDIALAEGATVLDYGYPNQADVAEWATQFHSLDHTPLEIQLIQCMQLGEEIGEVFRGVVKRAQKIRGSYEEWTSYIRGELGDAFISLLNTADLLGFDLATVATLRWQEKISKRDFLADSIQHGLPEEGEVAWSKTGPPRRR